MRWLWIFYGIGWTIHLMLMALSSISSSSNGLRGWRGLLLYLRSTAPLIVARMFLSTCLMMIWLEHPELFTRILMVNVPLAKGTCGVAGFLADNISDKIAYIFFKVEIPKLFPPQQQQP